MGLMIFASRQCVMIMLVAGGVIQAGQAVLTKCGKIVHRDEAGKRIECAFLRRRRDQRCADRRSQAQCGRTSLFERRLKGFSRLVRFQESGERRNVKQVWVRQIWIDPLGRHFSGNSATQRLSV